MRPHGKTMLGFFPLPIADAVRRALNREHQKLFPVASRPEVEVRSEVALDELDGHVLRSESDARALVEELAASFPPDVRTETGIRPGQESPHKVTRSGTTVSIRITCPVRSLSPFCKSISTE